MDAVEGATIAAGKIYGWVPRSQVTTAMADVCDIVVTMTVAVTLAQ